MTDVGHHHAPDGTAGRAVAEDERFWPWLAATLRRPVSRGFAILLVACTLLAISWMLDRQQEILEQVGHSDSFVPEVANDDVCSVVGALARANGDGQALRAALADVRTPSDCLWRAAMAADGDLP